MNVLDLFSGIGGFSLGLERAGMRTVAFCEIEPFCRQVLAKHWPNIPIYDDVRTLTAERLAADGIRVDVIAGGFPCQDISDAGHRAGIDGERSGLWGEYRRLIGEIRPRFAIVENVSALLGRGLDRVLGDLSALGYDAEWEVISASEFGAPHLRERVWIVAHAGCECVHGIQPVDGRERSYQAIAKHDGSVWPFAYAPNHSRIHQPHDTEAAKRLRDDAAYWASSPWDEGSPKVCRMDDGVPDRVDRCSALGNAVVPQIPEIIGRAILEAEAAMKQPPTPAASPSPYAGKYRDDKPHIGPLDGNNSY